MARYDAGWGGGRYDTGYQDRNWGTRVGGENWWERGPGGPMQGYDRGGAGGWGPDDGGAGDVYGPSRYGLGPYHERLRSRRRPDEELREEVEEALFYDTWVDAEAITVEVKDGVVTLRGELPNYEEVRYATDDAWDVDGVVGVRSQLTVRRG